MNKKPARKATAVNHAGKPKARTSATAAAILGSPTKVVSRNPTNGKPKIKQEWSKYYDNLLELRERLMAQMSGLAKESAEENFSKYLWHI